MVVPLPFPQSPTICTIYFGISPSKSHILHNTAPCNTASFKQIQLCLYFIQLDAVNTDVMEQAKTPKRPMDTLGLLFTRLQKACLQKLQE